MPIAFKKQIEMMSKKELEELKDKLFQEMDDCPRKESWRTLESLNMKRISIGRKIIQVSALLYSPDSEEFKKCKARVYSLNPRYRPATEEEKNEKVIYMITNEINAEPAFISRTVRKLGYHSRYPRNNEERQCE